MGSKHCKQAPGINYQGEANRVLRRAFLKRKPWAVDAVRHQANEMGKAAAAVAAIFAGLSTEADTVTEDQLVAAASNPVPTEDQLLATYTPDHLMPTEPMPAEAIAALDAE